MPRVALVQFAPLNPDESPRDGRDPHEVNLATALDYVRQAKAQGAELVCFPEYFLSGVVADRQHWNLAQYPHTHAHLHDDHPEIRSSSSARTQHWLSAFRDVARELKVDIAVGTIVERQVDARGDEVKQMVNGEERNVLNNVAHYIDWNGEVIGRYVKRNLWWPEKDYLTAGEEDHQVFETRFGRAAFLICWDLAHGEAFLPLLRQKVDFVIAPTYWTNSDGGDESKKWDDDSERKWLDSLVVSRAFENEAGIVFINVGSPKGTDPKDKSTNPEERIGCSQVCLPFKGRIGGTASPEEEMVVVDMDLSVLADARSVYGMRRGLAERMKKRGESIDA
ncbi:hypothetical protein JCM10212_001843 [Sporobolomyces blumeae]